MHFSYTKTCLGVWLSIWWSKSCYDCTITRSRRWSCSEFIRNQSRFMETIKPLVDMLTSNMITVDVQPWISKRTGAHSSFIFTFTFNSSPFMHLICNILHFLTNFFTIISTGITLEFSQETFSIFLDQSVLVSYPPTLELSSLR